MDSSLNRPRNPASQAAAVPTSQRRQRLPLGSGPRRLSYDLRLRLWLTALMLPIVVCAGLLAWIGTASTLLTVMVIAAVAMLLLFAAAALLEQVTRPLQTLSNVVAALRDDDFSFRARGARRGDSVGDLAIEINALAGILQAQRGSARDALTLAERVMGAMRTPVLAFAADATLRLINPAAESAFHLARARAVGQSAQALGLDALFHLHDGAVHAHPAVSGVAGEMRWSVRRSRFRLGGVPHELFVLSDVHAALREEERVAWQRLIRVLSHEINNSLTPITSLAGSLRNRLTQLQQTRDHDGSAGPIADLHRGLHLIEDRAVSLHRFLQAYQALTRLPRPELRAVSVPELLQRVVSLETRLPVRVLPGPALCSAMDPTQIEQLLINLLANAVEAAESTATPEHPASVEVSWEVNAVEVTLRVEDNGPGLTDTANLFVPFYTTKPYGSGIGLPLAKQIAAGHNGSLTLRNRSQNGGCIAEVRLPLLQTASEPSAAI